MTIWPLLFRYRWVLASMIGREVASRYAGSVLGLVWLIAYPLSFLTIYSFVFLRIFTLQGQKMPVNEYLLLIYCGLIPFLAIAECMATTNSAVVANRDIITATLFPPELLPVRYAGASMAVLLVGMVLLVPAAWTQGIIFWTQALIPLVIILQFIFMIGIGWIFSTIYVFFRDFGQIVSLLTLMLMLLSPIAFDRSMLPAQLKAVSALNPLFPFMESYRGLMLRGEIPASDLVASAVIALVTFHFGAFLFTRLKVAFGDYV